MHTYVTHPLASTYPRFTPLCPTLLIPTPGPIVYSHLPLTTSPSHPFTETPHSSPFHYSPSTITRTSSIISQRYPRLLSRLAAIHPLPLSYLFCRPLRRPVSSAYLLHTPPYTTIVVQSRSDTRRFHATYALDLRPTSILSISPPIHTSSASTYRLRTYGPITLILYRVCLLRTSL